MSTAAMQFKKAVKTEAKGRVALIGPSGSGKSYTGLMLARALVGPQGKIAAVDTEHGSLSKYADLFDFDVIELDVFNPDNFMGALKAAEESGYNAFFCDSLSHFWMGQGGALEWVDMAKKRSSSRDDMAGWKDFSPVERRMIDVMIASPLHVICTMRTKTEYQEQVNERTGKKQRVKIGLAPVQRQGLEYEFDLIGYMDDENTFITDKTRCPELAGKAYTRPGQKEFAPFIEWLKGAPSERKALKPELVQPSTPSPELPVDDEFAKQWRERYNSALDNAKALLKQYADGKPLSPESDAYKTFWNVPKWANVAKLGPKELEEGNAKLKAVLDDRDGGLANTIANTKPEDSMEAIWSTQFAMLADFKKQKARVGETDYYEVLNMHGVAKSNEFKTPAAGIKCFLALRSLKDHVPERGELQDEQDSN